MNIGGEMQLVFPLTDSLNPCLAMTLKARVEYEQVRRHGGWEVCGKSPKER